MQTNTENTKPKQRRPSAHDTIEATLAAGGYVLYRRGIDTTRKTSRATVSYTAWEDFTLCDADGRGVKLRKGSLNRARVSVLAATGVLGIDLADLPRARLKLPDDSQRVKIRAEPKAKVHKVSVERGQPWEILACTPQDAACEAARLDPEAEAHFGLEDEGPLYVLVNGTIRLWVWKREESVPVEHVKKRALKRAGFDPTTVCAVTYYAVEPRDDYADLERWGF